MSGLRVLGAALLASVATILLGVAARAALSSSVQGTAIVVRQENECPTATEPTPSIEAAFSSESYAPGSAAWLVVDKRAGLLTLQVFRVGSRHTSTIGSATMTGVPVTRKRPVGSGASRRAITVRVGGWPSGL